MPEGGGGVEGQDNATGLRDAGTHVDEEMCRGGTNNLNAYGTANTDTTLG